MSKTKGIITRIVDETPNVKSFYVKPETKIDFKNGQHLIIFREEGKYHIGRPYSLISEPEEQELGFCIKHYPNGKLTTYLFERKVGDELTLSQAFGRLTLNNPDTPIVFMVTGTGIAPVISILKQLFNRGINHKIHLLFGVMTEQDIIYNDLLWEWTRKHQNFFFVPCLSNPSAEWRGRKGYVQNNLDAVPNWIENDYYLVGIHKMVEDCKKILNDSGVNNSRIFSETE